MTGVTYQSELAFQQIHYRYRRRIVYYKYQIETYVMLFTKVTCLFSVVPPLYKMKEPRELPNPRQKIYRIIMYSIYSMRQSSGFL
jgi:hypothetical protein